MFKARRPKKRKQPISFKDEIIKIGQRCSKLKDLDKRTPEQIIGYNESGIPLYWPV